MHHAISARLPKHVTTRGSGGGTEVCAGHGTLLITLNLYSRPLASVTIMVQGFSSEISYFNVSTINFGVSIVAFGGRGRKSSPVHLGVPGAVFVHTLKLFQRGLCWAIESPRVTKKSLVYLGLSGLTGFVFGSPFGPPIAMISPSPG